MAIFSLVLSGGTTNQDPLASLGGPPSTYPVELGVSNNLFPDFTGRDVALSATDYRCLYVFNDSDETLLGVSLWISEQFDDGADIDLGFTEADEVQQFSVQGTITGGTFTLTLGSTTTDAIDWESDNDDTASNMQDAINGIEGFEDVEVEATSVNVFRITFAGSSAKRKQDTTGFDVSALEYPDTEEPPVGSMIVITSGAPINTVAPLIDADTTLPPGVVFEVPTESQPKEIGDLAPAEGFPVWVRRQVSSDSQPTATDGFKIKVSGDRLLT